MKRPAEILAVIANRATAAAEVVLCQAAFATLQNSLPAIADLPETMTTGTSKEVYDKAQAKIASARRDALAEKKTLLTETQSSNRAAPQCLHLWFLPRPAAAVITAKVTAAAIPFARFKANVIALSALLQATPAGGSHNCYRYLNEHLRKPGGEGGAAKLDELLTALAANPAGWTPNAAMTDLLDTTYYLHTGLGQASIDLAGKGMGNRGSGVLATERHDPASTTSGWMSHLRTLRGLAAAARHTHGTVRVVHGTANPMLHTTDPAKLGARGSVSVPQSEVDRKPGARTLTGASRGYEYTIPGYAGARIIEVPRATRWVGRTPRGTSRSGTTSPTS